MKALGVIAEYNPFHEGHKYLIETSSALCKADVCISVMSGNFVQRGGFAYFDKWERAKSAVENGVDLVVELPQIYATGSSRIFAEAGIRILNLLGVDTVCFGSETGEIDILDNAASMIMETEGKHAGEIRANMKKGLSYPAAMTSVVTKHFGSLNQEILQQPNDILALEYLMAIKRNKFAVRPIAIKRIGEDHNKSASIKRKELLSDPEEGVRIRAMEKRFFNLLKYRISIMTKEEIESFDSATEGLGNKIKDEIRYANDFNDLIEKVKSKRYTYTRISRLLTHILLGIKPSMSMTSPNYIRPLSMNEKGSSYLRRIKKDKEDLIFVDDVAKVIKYGNSKVIANLEIDVRASDIYSLIQDKDLYSESDYIRKPAVLHD